MSAALEARIVALERQVKALLSLQQGTTLLPARSTLAVVDTGGAQTVQAQLDPFSVRDGIPVAFHFGHTASLPAGTDLHVSFIDGNRSKPVVIASGHQTYRLRGLAGGDSALYDSRGAYFWLTPTGPVINGAGMPTLVTGDLHVTGNIFGGWGGGDQVGLLSHRHGTGAAASGTSVPTPGT